MVPSFLWLRRSATVGRYGFYITHIRLIGLCFTNNELIQIRIIKTIFLIVCTEEPLKIAKIYKMNVVAHFLPCCLIYYEIKYRRALL